MSVAIVVLESLTTPFIYEAEEPQQGNWSGEWGNPDIAIHVAIPEGLDPQCIMAVKDGEEVTLVEDPAKVQAKTAQAWTTLRTDRNARLAACDWTQLQDAHLSAEKKSAWADYRQALRDLPDTVTDPTQVSVEWPQINTPSVPPTTS